MTCQSLVFIVFEMYQLRVKSEARVLSVHPHPRCSKNNVSNAPKNPMFFGFGCPPKKHRPKLNIWWFVTHRKYTDYHLQMLHRLIVTMYVLLLTEKTLTTNITNWLLLLMASLAISYTVIILYSMRRAREIAMSSTLRAWYGYGFRENNGVTSRNTAIHSCTFYAASSFEL